MDEATLEKMKPAEWAVYLTGLETRLADLQVVVRHQVVPAGGPVAPVDGADLSKKIVAEVRQVVAADHQEIRHVLMEQAKQEVGRKVETALKWYGLEGHKAVAILGQALDAWTEAGMPDGGMREVPLPATAAEPTLS